jgi:threonylcarbamoyladenosine tRNA methylthiotransferase MtaB
VLKEAKQLIRSGHREIVVTGIFLGAYGRNTARRKSWPHPQNDKLPELLEKLAQIPNLPRIRLSSLDPADITTRLLDVFCKYSNIMPHLHLSLQSGSDKILKKMTRQYNTDEFREKIGLIKNRLDKPAITCDLIVGFPGETSADFQKTVDLAKEVGFAKIHVFGFSPRKHTPAAKMKNKINRKVIKQRVQLLRDLDSELTCRFREQFVGRNDTILIEATGPPNSTPPAGRSKRYFMVQLENDGQNYKPGDLVTVKLLKNSPDKITAKPVTKS